MCPLKHNKLLFLSLKKKQIDLVTEYSTDFHKNAIYDNDVVFKILNEITGMSYHFEWLMLFKF